MVSTRLDEKARLAFFCASPRHFDFLNCETYTSKCLVLNASSDIIKHTFCHSNLHIGLKMNKSGNKRNTTKILQFCRCWFHPNAVLIIQKGVVQAESEEKHFGSLV